VLYSKRACASAQHFDFLLLRSNALKQKEKMVGRVALPAGFLKCLAEQRSEKKF
jgi:hypothetical protein